MKAGSLAQKEEEREVTSAGRWRPQKTEMRPKTVRKPRVGGCQQCPEMGSPLAMLLPSWHAPARWGKHAGEGKMSVCSEL